MNMKKIVSAILAGACALSAMSFAVSAVDTALPKMGTQGTATEAAQKMTYSINAMVQYPDLDVIIPSAGTVGAVLNPFGLQFTASTTYLPDIYSPQYEVTNNSPVGVVVNATVSGSPKGNAKLVEAIAADSVANDICMFVYGVAPVTNSGAIAAKTAAITEKPAATANTDAAYVTTKEQTVKLLTLTAKGATPTDTSKGAFAFDGKLNKAATLKNPWAATDGVTIKLVLDIAPKA